MTQWSDYSTGRRIKMLRAGMTQEELAEAAGVSLPTVRKAEKEGAVSGCRLCSSCPARCTRMSR